MKIIITGAFGFMGKNITPFLKVDGHDVFCFDRDMDIETIKKHLIDCDFVIHLAGVMRPKDSSEFYEVGDILTETILAVISKREKMPSLIYASSTQALLNNDYGISKKMCEDKLISFSKQHNMPLIIYRFTNAFGKWGRPNYNSVLSTFCYNISHSLPIFVRDPKFVVNFIYIDDIVDSIRNQINSPKSDNNYFFDINPVFPCSLGKLSSLINNYFECLHERHFIPKIDDKFQINLFSTFLTYFDLKDLYFETLISPYLTFRKCDSFEMNERVIQIVEIKKRCSFSLKNLNTNEELKWEKEKGFVLVPPGFEFSFFENDLGGFNFYSL